MSNAIKKPNFDNLLKNISDSNILNSSNFSNNNSINGSSRYTNNNINQISYDSNHPSCTVESLSDSEVNDDPSHMRFLLIENSNPSVLTDDWIDEVNERAKKDNIDISSYCNGPEEIELIYRYLKKVDDTINYAGLDLKTKLDLAKKVMNFDKNREIAHMVPSLKHGKVNTQVVDDNSPSYRYEYDGNYLQFYNEYGVEVIAPLDKIKYDKKGNVYTEPTSENDYYQYSDSISRYYADIMKSTESYSQKFRDTTMNHLKQICLVNFDDSIENHSRYREGIVAFAPRADDFFGVDSNMCIDTSNILGKNGNNYNFMVDTFTHELGHVFANSYIFSTNIDESREWKDIYEQLCQSPNKDALPIRDYAFKNSIEAFAECVAEYYGGKSGIYNPNDLKVINVKVNGKEISLYDYMKHILDE